MSQLIDRQAALDAIKFAELGCEYDEVEKVQIFNPWHRVEEPPKKDGWYMLCFLSRWRDGNWWIPKFPDYWMDATPPKEDA